MTGGPGLRSATAVLLLVLLGSTRVSAQEGGAPDAEPVQVDGTIEKDTTWSGEIVLTGDVVIPRDVVLRITPGCRIRTTSSFNSRPATGHDLVTALTEIHVMGRVEAVGSPDSPITFEPGSGQKEAEEEGPEPVDDPWPRGRFEPAWFGVVLHPERDEGSRFAHCVFEGAFAAVQCGSGKPRFDDCAFIHCGIGVGSGTIWCPSPSIQLIRAVSPAPRLRRCRFGSCRTGVYLDLDGRPVIERCIFAWCSLGVGQSLVSCSHPITGLGPLIDRCDFLRNMRALDGSGSVRDSIFLANGLVASASNYHDVSRSIIDRYHRTHNVYHRNGAMTDADVPPGTNGRFEAPGYRGPLPQDERDLLSADLADRLSLIPGSPLLRAASDGGSPGSYGNVGSEIDADPGTVPAGARPLTRWLVPGPRGAYSVKSGRALAVKLRRGVDIGPGDVFGEGLFALHKASGFAFSVPPPAVQGSVDAIWLLAGVEADTAGRALLAFGFDGRALAAAWNGRDLPCSPTARRFQPADQECEVEVRAGLNVFLVGVVPLSHRLHVGALLAPLNGVSLPTLSPAWAPEAARPKTPIKTVIVSAGRRKGRGKITITLSTRLHWLDVTRRDAFRLTDAKQTRIPIEPGQVTYDTGAKKVRIGGLTLTRGQTYTLRVGPFRDCYGREIPRGKGLWEVKAK